MGMLHSIPQSCPVLARDSVLWGEPLENMPPHGEHRTVSTLCPVLYRGTRSVSVLRGTRPRPFPRPRHRLGTDDVPRAGEAEPSPPEALAPPASGLPIRSSLAPRSGNSVAARVAPSTPATSTPRFPAISRKERTDDESPQASPLAREGSPAPPAKPRASSRGNGARSDRGPRGERPIHDGQSRERARGRGKRAAKKLLGKGATEGDAAIVARDAQRAFRGAMRELPHDGQFARSLAALYGRHLAASAFYAARSDEAGPATGEGIRLADLALKHGARAERLAISALDVASTLAKAKPAPAFPWLTSAPPAEEPAADEDGAEEPGEPEDALHASRGSSN